jgi:molybdopterin-biosynthesis enzyme MoeA-like protein
MIRGSHRRTVAARARLPKNQKIAALPSGATATHTAIDAAPILVLRGTRYPRYALAGAPPPAPEPLLTVIRGARPRPILLQPYVQPNALILHIRH